MAAHEHHVVGDVDYVADRALPSRRKPCLQPDRRRADSYVFEDASREARAESDVFDRYRYAGGLLIERGGSRVIGPWRRAQRGSSRGVDFARDPVEAAAVAAVRRHFRL